MVANNVPGLFSTADMCGPVIGGVRPFDGVFPSQGVAEQRRILAKVDELMALHAKGFAANHRSMMRIMATLTKAAAMRHAQRQIAYRDRRAIRNDERPGVGA